MVAEMPEYYILLAHAYADLIPKFVQIDNPQKLLVTKIEMVKKPG